MTGNGRWQQKQPNSKTPCDLKNHGHMNPHSYQCVRKTFSAPFVPQPVENHTYDHLARQEFCL